MEHTEHQRLACIRRVIAACALALSVLGCSLPAAEERAPALSQHTRVSDRLYFGRAHTAGMVSEGDWARFLAEVVTPRFPDGLTVWVADGQWRDGANRAMVREPTFVLELVHMRHGPRDADLKAIVTEYKQRFSQQSVMWIRDRVTVID